MRKTLLALIFVLAYNLAQAQPQLPISPTLELPQDYQTWQQVPSKKLTIRNDLVAISDAWVLIDDPVNETGKIVMLLSLNGEVVYAISFESFSAPPLNNQDSNQALVTLNLLVDGGYIKLVGSVAKPANEEVAKLAWKMWDKFIRNKFNVNDKELEELAKFLP